MNRTFKRATTRVVLLLLVSVAGGCNCFKDVTHDSDFGFEPLSGRCCRLTQDLYMTNEGDFLEGPKLSIEVPGKYSYPTVEEYHSPGRDKIDIEEVLPKGTRIQINRLVHEQCETGGEEAYGVVLDGRYRGKTVSINQLLAAPRLERFYTKLGRKNWLANDKNPTDTWRLDSRYAETCDPEPR